MQRLGSFRSLLSRLIAALLVAGLVSGVETSALAKTFKLASLAPAESAWGQLIEALASEVKTKTGGKVRFRLFLGGKLGDESKVAQKLGRGLDGA